MNWVKPACYVTAVTWSFVLATSCRALPATSPPEPPAAVQSAINCRALSDDHARLACYDGAVEALRQALAAGAVVAVDHAQVQAVRRQAFGFTLPSLKLFGGGGEDVPEVALAVESAQRGGDGKWVLRLEGGQVWRQIDTGDFSRDPKPGAKATIKRAMLGSYLMTIGGNAGVRVHRDQ